jgi:uncharacterized protein with ParB-like and HNH nuclease domain
VNINPESKKLQAIFHGLGTQYKVPRYQRDYSWTKDQIEQLWSDLTGAFRANQDYFLGSIVVMPEESGGDDNVFQIVDGQQRLTTSTILLCAIRDMARQYVDRMSTPWFASVDRTTESKEAAQRTIDYARQAIVLSGEPDH